MGHRDLLYICRVVQICEGKLNRSVSLGAPLVFPQILIVKKKRYNNV